MKEFTPENIRNVALIGHGGAGKTSLAEALLFSAGSTTRLGKVEEGNTLSDYHPDEVERQISINTSVLFCEWKSTKINILDTPGYTDFTGEVKSALRVADTALVLVKAVEGIEVGTEIVGKYTNEYKTGVVFVVNKLDNENSDFDRVVQQCHDYVSHEVEVVQFPLNQGLAFDTVIDVIKMKALKYQRGGNGKYAESEIPAEVKEKADTYRRKLLDAVAELDEAWMNKYFETGTLTDEELKAGLHRGIHERNLFPILCCSAAHNIGVTDILDFVVEDCPAPPEIGDTHARPVSVTNGNNDVTVKPDPKGEPSLFVFKTVSEAHVGELSFFRVYSGTVTPGMDMINEANGKPERLAQIYIMNGKERKDVNKLMAGDIGAVVKLKDTHTNDTLSSKAFPVVYAPIAFPEPVYHLGIVPRSKGDEDKIANGLHSLHQEDPTFVFRVDAELHQTIISGQGELHLQVIVKRLKQKFNVDVDLVEPKVAYRETIKTIAKDAEYKHKKQSGGHGQYGHVHLRLEPLKRGQGFEFLDEIVGGVVPGKFIPAVEKGVVETMKDGVLAGYPVVDVRVALHYGSYHDVDSSEMAFKIAGSQAFKKGFMEAKPILLEPIYNIEVKVPEDAMGEVMGDISGRRGKILGMDSAGHYQIIRAQVPQAELHKYATVLRSKTGGRGVFSASMSHYEEVPREQVEKIIAASDKNKNKEQEA
ncbi:MAG: elongation factor G [Bacteroidetes bacterium]|nr:elongation factor G [Bacteroidota bacterium]MCW5895170.1 elongation factor G [Bacteroidota bacterium]